MKTASANHKAILIIAIQNGLDTMKIRSQNSKNSETIFNKTDFNDATTLLYVYTLTLPIFRFKAISGHIHGNFTRHGTILTMVQIHSIGVAIFNI